MIIMIIIISIQSNNPCVYSPQNQFAKQPTQHFASFKTKNENKNISTCEKQKKKKKRQLSFISLAKHKTKPQHYFINDNDNDITKQAQDYKTKTKKQTTENKIHQSLFSLFFLLLSIHPNFIFCVYCCFLCITNILITCSSCLYYLC